MSAFLAAKGIGWTVALAVRNFVRDDGSALAGYMAYTALLCLFPFLILATALSGFLIGEEGVVTVMNFLFANIPEHVAKTIQPVVEEVVRNRSLKVIGFSALGAVWIASNGFEALRAGLERAYGVKNYRRWWISRLISIGFVFVAIFAFFALAVLIVFGPSLIALAQEYTGALAWIEEFLGVDLKVWTSFRYIFGAAILIIFLVVLHHALPAERPPIPIFRGVLVTVVLWMLLASAFSVYFRFVPSYAITYGTLGGVIATLLFFYVSAAIFIFGAEINAACEAEPTALDEANEDDNKAESSPLL